MSRVTGSPLGSVNAFPDVINMGTADAIILSYYRRGAGICADSAHLLVGKSCVPVPCGSRSPILIRTIPVIVGLGADSEVGGVDAGRVVADVHNDKSLRDGALDALVGISVRPDLNLAGQQKNAVPVGVFGSSPQPARFGLFHAAHEYVLGAVHWVNRQRPGPADLVVAFTAKPATDRQCAPAPYAHNRFSSLIAHVISFLKQVITLPWEWQIVI